MSLYAEGARSAAINGRPGLHRTPTARQRSNRHIEGLDRSSTALREDISLKTEERAVREVRDDHPRPWGAPIGRTPARSWSTARAPRADHRPRLRPVTPRGSTSRMTASNYLMAYFSQPAHRARGDLHGSQELLRVGPRTRSQRAELCRTGRARAPASPIPPGDNARMMTDSVRPAFGIRCSRPSGENALAICGNDVHRASSG